MARDISSRLSSLHERRRGVDARSRSRIANSSLQEAIKMSHVQETWERRASNQPHTRYALGAMEAVDAGYTQKSFDEAERVAKQLRDGLSIAIETRLQGSVPLDVHIRGVSDVDLLVLRADFRTYAVDGVRSRAGLYGPSTPRSSADFLLELRLEAEELLPRRFWGATVDCSGAKCIALSGGSFERPVDVVPAHWDDTIAYQASQAEHDRGVTILNKPIHDTIDNLPFTHIKRVHDRDRAYRGGLKKAIRLAKNVKNDAERQEAAARLASFDIAALLYHADENWLAAGAANELCVLAETQRFFDWCYAYKTEARQLTTPDGSRRILDDEGKFDGLLAISCELDELAKQVAAEQGLLGASPSLADVRRLMSQVRIPTAA